MHPQEVFVPAAVKPSRAGPAEQLLVGSHNLMANLSFTFPSEQGPKVRTTSSGQTAVLHVAFLVRACYCLACYRLFLLVTTCHCCQACIQAQGKQALKEWGEGRQRHTSRLYGSHQIPGSSSLSPRFTEHACRDGKSSSAGLVFLSAHFAFNSGLLPGSSTG